MSATRTTPTAPVAADAGPGPVPRRVRPPRWLDLRLVLGVLLVLGSVLLGARVVTAADATVPVWSAAGDLAAGTVLTAEDLVAVDVRLDDVAGAYLATSTRPEGRVLARAVRAGELLPRSVLEDPAELVQLALPVQAGFVPPGLTRGQVVDVYAVADPPAGAAAPGAGITPVVAAAPVQAVSGRSEGVLSTATTTVQVVVSVPLDRAAGVLGAIAGRPLVVVVHESVDGGGGASTGGGTSDPGTASPGAAPSSGSGPSSGSVQSSPPAGASSSASGAPTAPPAGSVAPGGPPAGPTP